METKVVLKNEEGMTTKVIIPDDCDFEVKDRVIVMTPKKVVRTWEDLDVLKHKKGFYIDENSEINEVTFSETSKNNKNIFKYEKHAKSALAMAQISQLMPYYGSEITNKEWEDESIEKYVIDKYKGDINEDAFTDTYFFLAFHTEKQRDDFLKYNEQLVKDYLMIE